MPSILILGDSTSMTIGLERKSYPYLLADRLSWPEGAKIVNISQPGITASDAAAYFFRFIKKYPDLKAVIVYLGNCDANANELCKGRVTPLRLTTQKIRETFGLRPPKTVLRNRLMRLEWNESYDESFERAEKAEDFEYNLGRVISACGKRSIPVILVRPKANNSFPSGVGKGNFAYYHYLSFSPHFTQILSHPDQRFLDAFALYEQGRFEESSRMYREILAALGASVARAEYPLIIVHNYAAACARQGRNDEALVLFDLLLKESAVRQEIVLFNRAFVLGSVGDRAGSKACLSEAYKADSSMYRVKSTYLDAIDRLAASNASGVQLVDMSVFSDDDFVDHCHLLPGSQKILADRIEIALRGKGVMNGTMAARIEPHLLNLELALGNTMPFFHYYRAYASITAEQIRRDIDILSSDVGGGNVLSDRALSLVSKPVAKAVEYSRQHPCFADIRDFLRLSPEVPLDVGRFPEYFLIRRLSPYLEAAWQEAPVVAVLSGIPGLLHSGKELLQILPVATAEIKMEIPAVDSIIDKAWASRIVLHVRSALIRHLEQGPQIHERLKTTIFWYFREVLRWGSHSRVSMRYERLVLEFMAEALTVASWLDFKSGMEKNKEILELAKSLVRTIQIHEKYCLQFKLGEDNKALFEAYSMALKDEALACKRHS